MVDINPKQGIKIVDEKAADLIESYVNHKGIEILYDPYYTNNIDDRELAGVIRNCAERVKKKLVSEWIDQILKYGYSDESSEAIVNLCNCFDTIQFENVVKSELDRLFVDIVFPIFVKDDHQFGLCIKLLNVLSRYDGKKVKALYNNIINANYDKVAIHRSKRIMNELGFQI